MYRKIMGFLTAWKESGHRKPLILQGAGQVGKTYSVLEFGRTHYENVAYKNLAADDILYMSEELNDFKGGMAENYVSVHLVMNGYSACYWESKRGAEIDFVIQRNGRLIPVEVKSSDNTRAKSLKVYVDTYKPDYAIKISAKNFGFEDGKKTVPLYAVFCV